MDQKPNIKKINIALGVAGTHQELFSHALLVEETLIFFSLMRRKALSPLQGEKMSPGSIKGRKVPTRENTFPGYLKRIWEMTGTYPITDTKDAIGKAANALLYLYTLYTNTLLYFDF